MSEAASSPLTEDQKALVRRLVEGARMAALSTLGDEGQPYGSLVTLAFDEEGRPLLLLSGLADHTRNLERDPRLSLLIEAASHLPNPQAGPRLTLQGRGQRLRDPDQRAEAADRFLARHPSANFYAGFADFSFWIITVEALHLVGGFAQAVWVKESLTSLMKG